jgi:hypothetical protein
MTCRGGSSKMKETRNGALYTTNKPNANPWGNNALFYGQHRKEYQNPVINKNAEMDNPKGQRDDSKIKKGWPPPLSQLKDRTYFHSYSIIIASRSHSILFAFL